MRKSIIIVMILGVLAPLAASGQPETDTVIDLTDTGEDVVEIELSNDGLRFTHEGEKIAGFRVPIGATVRVTYTSASRTHDWVIDEFDAATDRVSAGESDTAEFVASEAGTFEYYCSVPGHRAAGMVGDLIVVE